MFQVLSSRTKALLGTLAVGGVAVLAVVVGLGALPDITRSRLPGAAGGSSTYTVEAHFRDALDLVPNSTVRVADVPVGRVTAIDVVRGPNGYGAEATLEIDDTVQLPADTVATLSSTSLLGEKYVALVAPARGTGSLRRVGSIPISRTSDDIEVEKLLSSLGALLNGGGLQQLSTITGELSTALSGREQDVRDLLGDLNRIVSGLDRGRPQLVSALTSTARLNRLLADQNTVLATSVKELDPATGVLADQMQSLRTALNRLDRLSGRATSVIRRITEDTVADLRALAPVAQQLAEVADQIPRNLTLLVTYPFADTSVPAFSGVYGAFKGTVVVSLKQLLEAVAPAPSDSTAPFEPGRAPADSSGPAPLGGLTEQVPDALGLTDLVGGLGTLLDPRTGGRR